MVNDLDGQRVKQAATSWDGAANLILWLDGAPHLFIDGVWHGTGSMAFLRKGADAAASVRWQEQARGRRHLEPMKWTTAP